MRAVRLERYGNTDDLEYVEVPRPVPKPDEVLVKLHYTSLNAADLDYVHGHPLVRFTGLRKPAYPILGSDCVGEVVGQGDDVERFALGQIVWADLSLPLAYGTLAEYVTVPASALQLLPSGVDPKEAACLPTAGMVALQNIRMKKPVRVGDKVLVNGAGGGIGTILVQLL